MLLCCRVLLQVSSPGGCLLALSTKETFLQSRLDSRRGWKQRGRQASLQNLDSGSEIWRKEKIVQWDIAILMAELGITRYLPKVPLSFVTINTLNTISEHCGCLFWDQGSSEWWVEAGCDQRSSQTAHPTSTLFLGVNRFIRNVFSIYVEKVWKLENTIPQLYSWGWTGL